MCQHPPIRRHIWSGAASMWAQAHAVAPSGTSACVAVPRCYHGIYAREGCDDSCPIALSDLYPIRPHVLRAGTEHARRLGSLAHSEFRLSEQQGQLEAVPFVDASGAGERPALQAVNRLPLLDSESSRHARATGVYSRVLGPPLLYQGYERQYPATSARTDTPRTSASLWMAVVVWSVENPRRPLVEWGWSRL